MKRKHKLLMLSALMLISLSSFANPVKGLDFAHHDWELACDNTGTCRAAGYHSEEVDGEGLSVLLTRKAGQGTVVEGHLKIAEYDGTETREKPSTVSLNINGKDFGKLTNRNETYSLSQQQIEVLIKAVSGVSTVLFQNGQRKWALSDKGATAVLVKMDEFQRRLGTRGALIREGKLDEKNVLKAKPMPIIKKPKLAAQTKKTKPIDTASKAVILAALRQTLNKGEDANDCPELAKDNADFNLDTIHQLNSRITLVSTLCWRAAYNGGQGFWLMDTDLKQAHKLITVNGTDYENGVISETHKARGLGDCFRGVTRVWNGEAFVLAEKYSTGMCRLIEAGGAWMLPTAVSEIQSVQ